MNKHDDWRRGPTAVLASGGLDSAALVAELSESSPCVQPIYVRFGLRWEGVEEARLRDFLATLSAPAVQPLLTLPLPIAEVYGKHWSTVGEAVPDADSPDEAVFLPGRNLLLLAPTLVWCHCHDTPTILLGTLAANPFPDATEEFFQQQECVADLAFAGRTRLSTVRIVRPYAGLKKYEVIQRGRSYRLDLSFSCIDPVAGQHCGRCNKCAERQRAFAAAGVTDRTVYVG